MKTTVNMILLMLMLILLQIVTVESWIRRFSGEEIMEDFSLDDFHNEFVRTRKLRDVQLLGELKNGEILFSTKFGNMLYFNLVSNEGEIIWEKKRMVLSDFEYQDRISGFENKGQKWYPPVSKTFLLLEDGESVLLFQNFWVDLERKYFMEKRVDRRTERPMKRPDEGYSCEAFSVTLFKVDENTISKKWSKFLVQEFSCSKDSFLENIEKAGLIGDEVVIPLITNGNEMDDTSSGLSFIYLSLSNGELMETQHLDLLFGKLNGGVPKEITISHLSQDSGLQFMLGVTLMRDENHHDHNIFQLLHVSIEREVSFSTEIYQYRNNIMDMMDVVLVPNGFASIQTRHSSKGEFEEFTFYSTEHGNAVPIWRENILPRPVNYHDNYFSQKKIVVPEEGIQRSHVYSEKNELTRMLFVGTKEWRGWNSVRYKKVIIPFFDTKTGDVSTKVFTEENLVPDLFGKLDLISSRISPHFFQSRSSGDLFLTFVEERYGYHMNPHHWSHSPRLLVIARMNLESTFLGDVGPETIGRRGDPTEEPVYKEYYDTVGSTFWYDEDLSKYKRDEHDESDLGPVYVVDDDEVSLVVFASFVTADREVKSYGIKVVAGLEGSVGVLKWITNAFLLVAFWIVSMIVLSLPALMGSFVVIVTCIPSLYIWEKLKTKKAATLDDQDVEDTTSDSAGDTEVSSLETESSFSESSVL